MTAVTLWTGVMPPAEAAWLAGDHGPLTGSDCTGSIGASETGRIWVDDAARAWLSLLPPDRDGAVRWTGDDAAEIMAGGRWYRLQPDAPGLEPGR